MPGWRFWIRQKLMQRLSKEMDTLQGIQVRRFFLFVSHAPPTLSVTQPRLAGGRPSETSTLSKRVCWERTRELKCIRGDIVRYENSLAVLVCASRSFFMIFLPLWYWFGDAHIGRGCVGSSFNCPKRSADFRLSAGFCTSSLSVGSPSLLQLASSQLLTPSRRLAGAYVTSVAKDAFSVPRPYSPPVVRLSVGSHALEYGFPSTHSSNACSMALFFAGLVLDRWEGHWAISAGAVGFAAFFAWSVTFGRLYTGMVRRPPIS